MEKPKSGSMERISIILPVFEEETHIKNVVNTIRDSLAKLRISLEFILVDDGSTDDTWKEIKNLSDNYKDIKALSFSRNFGKEYAIAAGLQHITGDAVIILDADLQHPPAVIPSMIDLWKNKNVKIVNAVKSYRGQESAFQRLTTELFYKLYKALIGVDLKGASDFKLLDKSVVEAYNNFSERGLFFRGLIPWLGFKTAFVPFEVQERISGRSKWTGFKRFILGADAVTSFSNIPLQFVTFAGIVFCIFSLFLGGQTAWMWLSGQAVEGFTTIILLLLIIGSILMLSLGIIGQYIAKIYKEIKARPPYIIQDKIGFTNDEGE